MKYLFLLTHLVLFTSFTVSATGGGGTQPPLSSNVSCPHLKYGTPKQGNVVLCRT